MRADMQINTIHSVGSRIRVTDSHSPYYLLEGTVARIGLANPFVLLHVVFEGYYGNSPMTVYERQVNMTENEPITTPVEEPIRVEEGVDEEPVINVHIPDQVVVPSEAPAEAPVKRGRGRPKGSKNKPK